MRGALKVIEISSRAVLPLLWWSNAVLLEIWGDDWSQENIEEAFSLKGALGTFSSLKVKRLHF